MQVTFRRVEDVEIVEVELLNGTVAAFLATDKEPESGQRWCDRFGAQYARFRATEKQSDEPDVADPAPEPALIPPPADII